MCDNWEPDGPCSVSCGGGQQRFTRTCTPNPVLGVSGADKQIKYETCNNDDCPVRKCNGWEATDDCSVTCGQGTENIRRICQWIHSDGSFGDREEEDDVRVCVRDPCPGIVDSGNFSSRDVGKVILAHGLGA